MSSGLRLRSIVGWGSVALILALFFMPVNLDERPGRVVQSVAQNDISTSPQPLPDAGTTSLANDASGGSGPATALTDAPGQSQRVSTAAAGLDANGVPLAKPSSPQGISAPKAPMPMGAIAALPQDKLDIVVSAPRAIPAGAQTQSPALQQPAQGDVGTAAGAALRDNAVASLRPQTSQPTALIPDSSGDIVAALTASPEANVASVPALDGTVDVAAEGGEKPALPALTGVLNAPAEEFAFLNPSKPDPVAVGASPAGLTLTATGGPATLAPPLIAERLVKTETVLSDRAPQLEQADGTAETPLLVPSQPAPVAPAALQIETPELASALAAPAASPTGLALAGSRRVGAGIKPKKPMLDLDIRDLAPAVVSSVGTSSASAQAQGSKMFVTGGRVNLRAAPGVAHAVVGQLSRGAELAAFETVGNWRRVESVKAGAKQTGWMSRRYLANTLPAVRTKAAATAVALRAKPSSAAKTTSSAPARSFPRRVATRAEVRSAESRIIRQSIAKFGGTCTCPYHRDRSGNTCGDSSEWSNPRGYSPICYASDISRRHLAGYFAQRGMAYRR